MKEKAAHENRLLFGPSARQAGRELRERSAGHRELHRDETGKYLSGRAAYLRRRQKARRDHRGRFV